MPGDLDREYAIWVNREELGKKKEIHLEGSIVTFVVPAHIDGHAVLRLKGLGHRSGSQKGNLLVRINLMEEDRGAEWSPFSRNRERSSEGGFGRFSRMQRPQGHEGGTGQWSPFTRTEPVNDPMKMRRAGSMITVAGLLLVSGGYLGILPLSAWAGMVIVVAGIILVFFA